MINPSDRWEYLREMRMSLGKWKGYPLSQVPVSYLMWAANDPGFPDLVLQMDIKEYVSHPKFKEELKLRKQQEETDIKLIPRAWRR